ncbi:nucleoside kinase [Anaeroselena agilis]|uniref:Nucleoside kinase n=1 Tax=Anaeroselena agilis TaxID=3063788 RepID=A0ABU3NWG8_9FIRM|nr:nucleoside kinase [Selenomonadales bacterium 4137-cl]
MACLYPSPIVAATVDNDVKDLKTAIRDGDRITFLDLTSEEGMRVYRRSLSFILVVAARDLFPAAEVTVEHSLGKGVYCELHLDRELTAEDVDRLQERMRRLVAEDRPFVRQSMLRADAIALFKASGQIGKVKLLSQLQRELVSVYYCGDEYDYFYGTMVPSTGYLKVFELKYHSPGFILRYPEKDAPEVLPPYVQQPKLFKVFQEAEQWGKILRCPYVANLNEYVEQGQAAEIIRIAEALHEKKMAQIADYISEHTSEVRVILVAGPSSSGKTTFAQRLNVQLRVNGVRPVPISLDDYFVDRDHTPRDEKGDYDFEAIEAIDLELFNEHLVRLLRGELVKLPTYNFMSGQREYRGRRIQIEPDQPLIIEGIHGLNERLTRAVPRENKIKIYISALTQLSIDNHNRIPTTDTRLIRRIVRDSQFRAHDALKTLEVWPSVRRGEERNIFPFQEEADIMFNSALIYELGVLRNCAEGLLQQVGPESPMYSEAKRLLNFLRYFTHLPDDDIPANSILREFVGKSCFYSP